ncbi:MAG: hypothetical protein JWO31_1456 [Phycisphaerales bacterium]|nr:hypothetical protein [Phycisphaerales bacterium]
MLSFHDGQCGLCTHFGEHQAQAPQLVQIRSKQQAPEDLRVECGHPKHAPLHLLVTANSGCDGFAPAEQVH